MKNKKLSSPYVWAFTTYFTEGFPYTIINSISSLFLRDMGVRLESIGLTSLFGLPWVLKFLWGPLVDRFSTKRSWMLAMQFLLVIMMLFAAIFAPLSWGAGAIAILFFIGSICAATHDTAIDGYYMEALDADGQAKYIGYRVMAYRIAMITGTGVVATVGTVFNWFAAFLSSTVIFGLFFLYHILFLPKVETVKHPIYQLVKSFARLKILLGTLFIGMLVVGIRVFYQSEMYKNVKESVPVLKRIWFSHWITIFLFLALLIIILFRNTIKNLIIKDPDSFYSKAFFTFIDRDKIGIILLSIIFMRTGEYMLTKMVAPFCVDLGIKIHYGWLSSAVGLPCSIAGALLGGWMISKLTLKKVIWPFLLLQNVTNVIYMFLALFLSRFLLINTGAEEAQSIGVINLILFAGVHAFDQFAGGLGTAVLMTFLMRLCVKEFKAAHYAIGTGLMAVSGVFVGVLGGFLCSWFGYGYYFGISFLFSIPGMVAVFFLPGYVFNKKLS
jgi:PAT family beta-lactamase induction signal transducer AmpG